MNNIFTKLYISPYSIGNFTSSSSSMDLENILKFLEETITAHKSFNNILIECVNDIYDYKINGSSFQDNLLDAFDFDESIYQYFLSELQKIVGEYINYNNTLAVKSLILNSKPLPISLPLTYNDSFLWKDLEEVIHTFSINMTLKINSDYIALNYTDESGFIGLCKIGYSFLDFHNEIENTLKTIKIGKFNDYVQLITYSLNILNQAYLIISTDPNKNLEDLDKIMILSHQLGKRLECTRQGKNKVEWTFCKPKEISSTETEKINCEYHLKIDELDDGSPIPRGTGNPVRIYFGLKSYSELDRKRIAVAHIGKHL